MRRTLLTVLSLLTAASLSAGAFVGTIQYRLTDPKGGTHDLTMSLSGSKVRTDMVAGKHAVASIMDLESKTLTVLMPDRKAYRSSTYAAPAAKPAKVTAVKTGQSATIAGYKADEWAVTHDGKPSQVWLTEQLGRGFFQQGSGPAGFDAPEEWKGKDLMLLRVVRPGGTTMEAVKVDTSAPDASLFSVPAGYTELSSAFGGAAMGGAAGADRLKAAMEHMTPAQRAAMQQYMKAQPGQ